MATPTTRKRSGGGGAETPIVVSQNLTKLFKDFWMRDRVRAVDGIDFQIDRGEVFGLLGPNGSGKSTTIKLILGLLKKSSGRLAVFGRTPFDVATKKRIGYLPEESYLYPFLNARETLDYYAKLFKLDRRARARRIDELLDMVGLTAVQNRQVREYSKGMQRRIGIAQALINDPEFLILDEPTTGLDPIGTKQVKELIIALGRRGKTILLSSHLLTDVEDCVDRMVILYGGKIREQGTCDDLLTTRSRSIIETEALDEASIRDVREALAKHNKKIESISAPRQKLEELFLNIVEQAQVERIATSGADQAGATAAFLVEQQVEGEDLIESLVTAGEDEHPAEAQPQVEQPREPAQHQSVIDDLVVDRDAAPEGKSPQRDDKGKPSEPSSDKGVDDAMISSLLGDKEPEKGQDGGSTP